MRNTLPIILIAVAIGLFYLYISPQYTNITALQTERDDYDEILSKSIELRQIRAELAEKTSRFSEAELAKLDKMIPLSMDLVRLVLEIDNLGLEAHDQRLEFINRSRLRRGCNCNQAQYDCATD